MNKYEDNNYHREGAGDSWLVKNDWLISLLAGFIIAMAPAVVSMMGVSLPSWIQVIASVGACISFLLCGLKARMSDTKSAKLVCSIFIFFGLFLSAFLAIAP